MLNNSARIGKSFLISIIGVQCNFKNNNIYFNEANRFRINKNKKLSKLQIKQILLYHFLGVDNNGIVKNISINSIAQTLNCSTKSIKNNNKRLIELNYMCMALIDSDRFNILLMDYKHYHLPSYQGGTGYITMSKELMEEIINDSSVNSLRLKIRTLIAFDNKNIYSDTVEKAYYSYNDLKRFLPYYLRSKNIINNLLDNKIFLYNIEKDGIYFRLKNEYNWKLTKENIIITFSEEIKHNIEGLNIKDKEMQDLYQMSIQYGLDKVKNALDIIKNESKNITIRNIGGLTRSIIEEYRFVI